MHSHGCCFAKQHFLSLGYQICEGLFQRHEGKQCIYILPILKKNNFDLRKHSSFLIESYYRISHIF